MWVLRILIVYTAAAIVSGSGPAVAGEVLDRVMSKKVLVLSSDAAYPPQSFMNEKNEMDGFDVEVAREIAKRLGA